VLATLDDYLEIIARAVFQTGLRWSTIAAQWPATRAAFGEFDVHRVAAYAEPDVERIMASEGVLHSPRKIRATIHNAQTLLDLDRCHHGFAHYLRAFPDYAALSADMQHRFAFLGDMNVWYVLFRAREPVPRFEEWVRTIPGDHPRLQELVHQARSAGTSTEYKP
jgi:3-methyladenine DNA glycosylase Tag